MHEHAATDTVTIVLSKAERELLAYMDTGPIHIDALALQAGHDISELLVLLFELELKKAVVQLPGQFFGKKQIKHEKNSHYRL